MLRLTGNCATDFAKWAIEKYGYSDIYYLGIPVVLEFFDQFIDWEIPKIKHTIGVLKERVLIVKLKETIALMNNLYNETPELHGK